MINNMQTCRALDSLSDAPLELTAHRWFTEVFEPIMAVFPLELQAKLESVQVFHEVLEHR